MVVFVYKLDVIGQKACFRAKVVVFGQKCFIAQSGCRSGSILANVVVLGQSDCAQTKVVFFRESGCIRVRVVLFRKSGCIPATWL